MKSYTGVREKERERIIFPITFVSGAVAVVRPEKRSYKEQTSGQQSSRVVVKIERGKKGRENRVHSLRAF